MPKLRLTRPILAVFAALIILVPTLAVARQRLAGSQQACPTPAVSDSLGLAVQPRADNTLIADATVQLAQPASVFLEYGNPELGWLRTPTATASALHQVPLLRLRAETPYQVRAFSVGSSGCPDRVAAAEVTTGPLPEIMRLYAVQSSGQPSAPLMLMDWPSLAAFLPPNAPGDRSRFLIAVDEAGKVVWYYKVPPDYPIPPRDVSAYPIKQAANGNLLYPAVYHSIEEITPDGKIARRFRADSGAAQWPHHEVTELPDGRVLYLGYEDRTVDDSRNSGPADLRVRGDTLHVANLSSGTQQQVWSAFDHLDPATRNRVWDDVKIEGALDWTHANAVTVGPRGNVLISIRHLDQVISLGPDLKTVEWRLGGPGSSFAFADPNDVFKAQHGVEQLANGHILMFDNGNFRPEGEYSRALELELDFATMTARKAWEYRPRTDIFADKLGNVVRLPNGNTLVNFGWREAPDEPGVLVELRPDGTTAWEQLMTYRGMRAIRYRATPAMSLAGEGPVQPTAAALP